MARVLKKQIKTEEWPETLYHYTTASGLLGILQEKKLWCTNINYLNDKKEFFHTLLLIKNGARRLQDVKKKTCLEAVRRLEKDSSDIYVCSFSQNRDQLSQWRGYCNEGSGFSIGFNHYGLDNTIREKRTANITFIFERCRYDKREQQDATARKIAELPTFAKLLTDHFLLTASFNKDSAFCEEAEWRLLAYGPNPEKICFRQGKTSIIPYCEVDIAEENGQLPVVSITIGPTQNMRESELALQILLRKLGLYSVDIIKSDVPYRQV